MPSTRMTSISTRRDSKNHQHRERVPTDVLAKAKGRVVSFDFPAQGEDPASRTTITLKSHSKVSLRTRSKIVAITRKGIVIAQLGALYSALRQGERALTMAEVAAIASEVAEVDEASGRPVPSRPIEHGPIGRWPICSIAWGNFVDAIGEIRESAPGRTSEQEAEAALWSEATLDAGIHRLIPVVTTWLAVEYGPIVDRIASSRGLPLITPASRLRVFVHAAFAARIIRTQKRRAAGNHLPDPPTATISVTSRPGASLRAAPFTGGRCYLSSLLEDWWTEARRLGRSPRTYESYAATVKLLTAFLGHDDASRITADDVIAFKDHRLASTNDRNGRPISPKTVKDSDLAALKSVLGWGVENRRLSDNPARSVTLRTVRRVITREKGFTDAEAIALLQAADARRRGGEYEKTFAAKRWVPWICAYTGARVGEIAQLRREDVRKVGAHWVMKITPEAGPVKTSKVRDVVMHEHLVEKGLPEFVEASAPGYLFFTPRRKDVIDGTLQGLLNRLREAARETVTDKRVQPNHGWRHRFTTLGRTNGVDMQVVNAIQGHVARTAGEEYGDTLIPAIVLAMSRIPRQGP